MNIEGCKLQTGNLKIVMISHFPQKFHNIEIQGVVSSW